MTKTQAPMAHDIPKMELRERIAAHEAEEKRILAQIEAIEAPYHERIAAAQIEMADAAAHLHQQYDGMINSHDIYDNVLEVDQDSYQCVRCCITGVILLEDDEIIEDMHGRRALACAVNWPAPPLDLPELSDAPDDCHSGSRPSGAEEATSAAA